MVAPAHRGLIEFIPTAPDVPYPLGRSIVNHDPANRAHRALGAVQPAGEPRRSPWNTVDVYDQGAESSCTAQAAVGVCRTQPNTTRFTRVRTGYDEAAERHALYRAAQVVDPWPGEDYEGSSTDAPFRVLRDRGHIAGWRWLFGINEVRQWVEFHGPCAVGTNWHEGMFTPDRAGQIRPSGQLVGGHAWRVVYYDRKRARFQLVNSWGRGWGINGRAWISDTDLGSLLRDGGEAATVVLPD